MKFNKTAKDIIITCVGEVLTKTYGEDYQTVLTMFADTPYPSPEAFIELTDEQHKQLENRFSYCITEAAIKDSLEELIEFLQNIAERLRSSHVKLKDAGSRWLENFLCDDNKSFLNLGIYLSQATIFGVDAERFYRKFTNTRKHGKKMYDANGNPVFHTLYSYSPISSSEYVPDLFLLQEYGEQYEKAANLYKDIIYVLEEAYKYVMSVDQMAIQKKAFPFACKKSLMECVDDVIQTLRNSSISNEGEIPTDAQILEARSLMPSNWTNKIFSLDIPALSTDLYHEVPTKYKKPFGVLVYDRIKQQQGLTDIESTKVFKHIENPQEKKEKAIMARIILKHLDEFVQIRVNGDNKTQKISRGNLACLFYIWTGTKMPANAFLDSYYNATSDKAYHIVQNTFSTAYGKLPAHSPLIEAFAAKAEEIYEKYQNNNNATTIPIVSKLKTKNAANKTFA